ncbi:stage V sporulation protein AC [Hathewaya proteolytica DSM 3090]|uniref:Stage V sporulation protein AC n=1 Tax=Hathewaya proteolytica DSM 3090 TaxID=1121331 RepID=A0A1M6P9W3_9CLOT|nr:stage V sporulation protein AC [Hathewaya proteolytica]SHK04746.1 stage V sporulation protein AC [Hathewaya proteolytica DSM 3090]
MKGGEFLINISGRILNNNEKDKNKKETLQEEKIKKKFEQLNQEEKPKPQILLHCFQAFWVGGLICCIGECFRLLYSNYFNLSKDVTGAFVSITMIFLGALLTGIGVYDRFAEYGGAGTLVPITGFSNAMVSPAIEFKKEGYVFGVAAKMFIIAGPVLVYGTIASMIVGTIYYFFVF